MANVCNCTNQCPGCGSCCRVACGCRRAEGAYWPRTVPAPNTAPIAPTSVPWPPGTIKFVPQQPLTEEDVKRIVREALAEALQELRELKGAA